MTFIGATVKLTGGAKMTSDFSNALETDSQ